MRVAGLLLRSLNEPSIKLLVHALRTKNKLPSLECIVTAIFAYCSSRHGHQIQYFRVEGLGFRAKSMEGSRASCAGSNARVADAVFKVSFHCALL